MLLREKDKHTLRKIFSSLNFPVEVWAYGSRVNGTAHEGSDLDLVIRNAQLTPLPATIFGELCEKIKDSAIPLLVELRDWALLPQSFHRNIEGQYEVFFNNLKNFNANSESQLVNEPQPPYSKKKVGDNDAEAPSKSK